MSTNFKLDMQMMYAVHDAFRRDLERVAEMTTRSEGWDVFEHFLRVHHEAEDEALWPVLRNALDGHADDLVLLDDMEAEHAVLVPLLDDIDHALDRGDSAPRARADLAARLEEHLIHEEDAALPVIDRALDEDQWMQFGEATAERLGPDMPTFLPWLLKDAGGERTNDILGQFPDQVQQTYQGEWQPAYATKRWWAT